MNTALPPLMPPDFRHLMGALRAQLLRLKLQRYLLIHVGHPPNWSKELSERRIINQLLPFGQARSLNPNPPNIFGAVPNFSVVVIPSNRDRFGPGKRNGGDSAQNQISPNSSQ